jgi:hypothetical protein
VVKILIWKLLAYIPFSFLLLGVRFQVSVFSTAAGRRNDQFDRKTDYSVAESGTSTAVGQKNVQSDQKRNFDPVKFPKK